MKGKSLERSERTLVQTLRCTGPIWFFYIKNIYSLSWGASMVRRT